MEFFDDLSVPVKLLIAFVVALAVLGVSGYLMRRFSGGNLAALGLRGRQPRLAVIDAARVDGGRRLVLVRRDNVEHLLLIGGPTDVVVEPNIDRTGAAATAPAPVRETKASPTLEPPPRQTPSLERSGWPPGGLVYVEPPPAMTGEAMLRPQLVPVERQRVESLIEDAGAPPPPIGGPTDVVVEPNIDRTGAAATAPAPTRETKASPTLEPRPRQTPSLEGSGWPPGALVYVEPPPAMTGEAMLRPQPVPVERQRVESLIEDAGAPPAPIGGQTDVVVEPNIDRTGAAATAPAPVRETKASSTLEPPPRQTPSLEGSGWPPGAPVYVESPPAVTGEAMLRPQLVPVERQQVESLIEDGGVPRLLPTPPPEPGPSFYPPPVPPSFEPVAHAPPAPPPFEPVFQIPPAREPKRIPAEPPLRPRATQNEESNLAEIAQWPEAALRRPIKPVEPVPSPPPPGPRFTFAPAPLPTPPARPPATAREPAAPAFPKEPVPERKMVPADKSAPPTPAFISIEEEMASLLGRSTGKS